MSNIFKFYINSYNKTSFDNVLTDLIVFLGDNFLSKNTNLDLKTFETFKKANLFINSNYYTDYNFKSYFNDHFIVGCFSRTVFGL